MWQVEFTENGLYTRHIFARNVIHVAISGHPGRPGRCIAKVWTRVRLADDGVFFLRARSYLDTKRKRDKIVRLLSAYGVTTGGRTRRSAEQLSTNGHRPTPVTVCCCPVAGSSWLASNPGTGSYVLVSEGVQRFGARSGGETSCCEPG